MTIPATRLAWTRLSGRVQGLGPSSSALQASGFQIRSFADEPSPSGSDGKTDSQEASSSSEDEKYKGLDTSLSYSKAQLVHYSPDSEKHKHFLPRMSRKDRGSYATPQAELEFFEEAERYPRVPENIPMYNLSDVVPEIYEPRSDLHERIKAAKEAMPGKSLTEILDVLGLSRPESSISPVPDLPGARPILEWESTLVLVTGVIDAHPANWKARCRVYLRDLQAEAGLSDEAIHHIARIAGPRYNPGTGRLLLACDRHTDREANRRVIMKQIQDLVAEGRRAFPLESEKTAAVSAEQ